jgi:hypothetical protein
MRSFVAFLVGILGSLSVTMTAMAQVPVCPCPNDPGTLFLVSGQPLLVVLDDDGNGPDPGDCSFAAFLNATNLTTLTIVPSTACGLPCFIGDAMKGADSTSNWGMVDLGCSDPPQGSLPVSARWVDETHNPSAAAPLRFDGPGDSIVLSGGVEGSGALLCNAGGPGALVNIPGLPSMLWPLSRVEKAGSQYLCVPDLPLAPTYNLVNAYIPVTPDGRLTLALKTSPQNLLVDVNLNTLPGCAQAPAASAWALIAMIVGLLAVGAWTLGRRPGFAQSLRRL